MEALYRIVGATVVAVGIIFLIAALCALPTWLLWNWLVPAIFMGPRITLFQAWGVNFLCSMLFKSSSTKD